MSVKIQLTIPSTTPLIDVVSALRGLGLDVRLSRDKELVGAPARDNRKPGENNGREMHL